MNVVQKNFRVTIVVVSALVLTIWGVFVLSTEPKESDQDAQTSEYLPYYVEDSIEYYSPGPEFRLARQAAIREAAEEEASQQEIDTQTPTLILGGVTPRIIIQEEEEEKLGILPP